MNDSKSCMQSGDSSNWNRVSFKCSKPNWRSKHKWRKRMKVRRLQVEKKKGDRLQTIRDKLRLKILIEVQREWMKEMATKEATEEERPCKGHRLRQWCLEASRISVRSKNGSARAKTGIFWTMVIHMEVDVCNRHRPQPGDRPSSKRRWAWSSERKANPKTETCQTSETRKPKSPPMIRNSETQSCAFWKHRSKRSSRIPIQQWEYHLETPSQALAPAIPRPFHSSSSKASLSLVEKATPSRSGWIHHRSCWRDKIVHTTICSTHASWK